MTRSEMIVLPRGDGFMLVKLSDTCLVWQMAWSATRTPDDGYEERVIGQDMIGRPVVEMVPCVQWMTCDTRSMLRHLAADEADCFLGLASHMNEQLETQLRDELVTFAAALDRRDIQAAGEVYASMGDALQAFQLLREVVSQLLQA